MNHNFAKAIENRRSIYAIGKESPITDQEIQGIIEHSVKHTPTSFNSQSARAVLLLGKTHERLWDLTLEILKKIVPENAFGSTEAKITSFRNGHGTVLFFEDQEVVQGLQEKYSLYKDNFPIWSLQSSGMLQLIVWTALEEAGLGANLQHYNPLIDEQVKREWELPEHWKLIAQMPFGIPLAAPEEKNYRPIETMVKTFE